MTSRNVMGTFMRCAVKDAHGVSSRSPFARELTAREVLAEPLPNLRSFDRLLLRAMALAARTKLVSIEGRDHIAPQRDPFILALNHSTRLEALLVPPLLMLMRSGKHIHFLADWNFQLIPGVATLYRRAGVITIARKPAKPRVLNALKTLFDSDMPPFEQARRCLEARRPIGVFLEGTVNRDPHNLLRGRLGAARLSLSTGVPVVPAGLRFPFVPPGSRIPEGSAMSIEVGQPLLPPRFGADATAQDVRAFHAHIMTGLSVLSGKAWHQFEENDDERIEIHQDASRRK